MHRQDALKVTYQPQKKFRNYLENGACFIRVKMSSLWCIFVYFVYQGKSNKKYSIACCDKPAGLTGLTQTVKFSFGCQIKLVALDSGHAPLGSHGWGMIWRRIAQSDEARYKASAAASPHWDHGFGTWQWLKAAHSLTGGGDALGHVGDPS